MPPIDGSDPEGFDAPFRDIDGGGPNTDFLGADVFPMVNTSAFLHLIKPYAPECPDMVIEQNTRLAAIELCETSRLWRYIVNTTITSDTNTMSVPPYATVHAIENAYFDNRVRLTPIQFEEIPPEEFGEANTGEPRYITQTREGCLTVFPFKDGDLRLSLYLKPRAGTLFGTDAGNPLLDYYNQVPEFMFIQYAEAIAAGALARVLAIPSQVFTNPELAMFYQMKWKQTLDKKTGSNLKGQQRAPRRTKLSMF